MSNMIHAEKLLHWYLDNNQKVMLRGAPGIGKSDLVKQYCAQKDVALIDIRVATIDGLDMRGMVHIENGLTCYAAPNWWPCEKRHGPRGILLFDEVNMGEPDVLPKLYQLGTDNRIGDNILPDGWNVVFAGNRVEDRAGRMPPALCNRMNWVDIEPDIESFVAYAHKFKTVHEDVLSFLKFRPTMLHSMYDETTGETSGEIPTYNGPYATPRSWVQASVHVDAPREIRFELLRGCVGEVAATEFEAYLKLKAELPPFAEVIADPENAPIPTTPSTQYAVASGLASRATKENFESIVTYAKRMPKEFEILVVIEATKRDSELCETATYVDWASKNEDCV